MQIGMVGLGRMGKNMALRLLGGGHRVVGWNRTPEPLAELAARGATAARDLRDLPTKLAPPRAVSNCPMSPPVHDSAVHRRLPLCTSSRPSACAKVMSPSPKTTSPKRR